MQNAECGIRRSAIRILTFIYQEGRLRMTDLSTAPGEQAALALRQSPIPALRRLAVTASQTELILTGRVPSYYIKQLAQEAILPYLNGRELVNRVAVVRS
jgi:hypothetical protein